MVKDENEASGKKSMRIRFLFAFVCRKTISTSIKTVLILARMSKLKKKKKLAAAAHRTRQRTIKFYLKITYRKKVK